MQPVAVVAARRTVGVSSESAGPVRRLRKRARLDLPGSAPLSADLARRCSNLRFCANWASHD
jgi:hypothetical protein